MVQINVSIDSNIDGVLELLGEANLQKGLFYMIDSQALPDMNNYVPLDGGELRMSGHREDDTVVWDTPYAGVQYNGTAGKPPGVWYSDKQRKWFFANFFDDDGNYIGYEKGYTTPGTGPEWDQVAFAAHGDYWMHVFLEGAGLL